MKLLKKIALVALLILTTEITYAQLTIGAQVRPRAEFRNGFKTLTDDTKDPAFFIEQRSRIWTDYKTDKFRLHINMQDVRIWGGAAQIYKADPALFNIYEGYGQYYINDKVSLKFGRMAITFDGERFLGALGWAAQGRSHDAVQFIYSNPEKGSNFDIGAAFNQSGVEPKMLFGTDYFGVANYKSMLYAKYAKKTEKYRLNLLIHNDGRQTADTTMAHRQTYAITGGPTLGNLSLHGEFYYQGGKNQADVDVSGIMAGLSATFKTGFAPITVGYEHMSGTSIEDDKDKSFNPLYGTNHKFYGFMDYFYVGNAHGQNGITSAGLNDAYIKTKIKTGDNSNLTAALHYFGSAAQLFDPEDLTAETSNYLGTEIDLVYTHNLHKDVKLNVGYSQMFAGESMEIVKTPGDHTALNNWAWIMIDFKPTIFKSEN